MSGKRDRLGRGLGALLGEYLGEGSPDPAGEATSVRVLPVPRIKPNPFQPRREFSDDELSDLEASMRQNGLLQPIVVRPARAADADWELVAGERRWRASVRLGWREIPAMVRDVDDATLLVLALVENLQRAGLSPLEEAEAFQKLAEEFSLSQQRIADLVGRDRSTVANAMRLLQLPASVRRLIVDGRLSAGHARALLGLRNDRQIAEVARQAVADGWSVRDVEARVQSIRGERRTQPKARARKARDPNELKLEEELARALRTAVRIRRSAAASGRIEIQFRNGEEFERVFEQLAGKTTSETLD